MAVCVTFILKIVLRVGWMTKSWLVVKKSNEALPNN